MTTKTKQTGQTTAKGIAGNRQTVSAALTVADDPTDSSAASSATAASEASSGTSNDASSEASSEESSGGSSDSSLSSGSSSSDSSESDVPVESSEFSFASESPSSSESSASNESSASSESSENSVASASSASSGSSGSESSATSIQPPGVIDIQFIDTANNIFTADDPIPAIPFGVFELRMHYTDAPETISPNTEDDGEVVEDGLDVIEQPAIPWKSSFKIRIEDAEQEQGIFTIQLVSDTQAIDVEMTSAGPGIFYSTNIFAITDANIDEETKHYFTNILFIDPAILTITYKGKTVIRVTATALLAHRSRKPSDHEWSALTTEPQPAPIEADTSLELYAEIRALDLSTHQNKYYLGYDGQSLPLGTVTIVDINTDPPTSTTHTLERWPTKFGEIAFDWHQVKPTQEKRENKKEPKTQIERSNQSNYIARLDYKDFSLDSFPWIYIPSNTSGCTYWSVYIQLKSSEARESRTHSNDDRGINKGVSISGFKDFGISKEVKRILRQGAFPGNAPANPYLRKAFTFIGVPTVFGARPTQYQNYLCVDCNKLCVAPYQKLFNDPKALADVNADGMVQAAMNEIAPNHNLISVVGGSTYRKGVLVDGLFNKRIFDINHSLLMPGDLIAMRREVEKSYNHIAIYLGSSGSGFLNGTDLTFQANYTRLQQDFMEAAWRAWTIPFIINIDASLATDNSPEEPGPFKYFTILRFTAFH